MADFKKHFEYNELRHVIGEIWTTHDLAILIVSADENNSPDTLRVETFAMHGRQWGEHPVTEELHTRIYHLMAEANSQIAGLLAAVPELAAK